MIILANAVDQSEETLSLRSLLLCHALSISYCKDFTGLILLSG